MTHTDLTQLDLTRRNLELSSQAVGLSGHVRAHGIRDLDEAHSILAALSQAEEVLAQLYGQIAQWCFESGDRDESAVDKLSAASFALHQASGLAVGTHERVQTARMRYGDRYPESKSHERYPIINMFA